MYSVSVRCSDHKKCALRARLGPPDSDCCNAEKMNKSHRRIKESQQNANYAEFEFADDAISLDKEGENEILPNSCVNNENALDWTDNSEIESKNKDKRYITVNGKEELPCVHEIKYYVKENNAYGTKEIFECHQIPSNKIVNKNNSKINNKNLNGNFNHVNMRNIYSYCTLPKVKKKVNNCTKNHVVKHIIPPKRITPDGTHIYYWCDIQKKDCGKLICIRFARV